jgi:hypothetical protein
MGRGQDLQEFLPGTAALASGGIAAVDTAVIDPAADDLVTGPDAGHCGTATAALRPMTLVPAAMLLAAT